MRRLTIILLGVYVVLTFYSVLVILLGLPFQRFITPLSSLLAFSFALLHASQRLGWRRAILLWFLTFAVSLAFESIGVATGFVYGPYHYTDLLGLKFLGLVPYIIPVVWFMMVYPSFIIADRLMLGVRRAGFQRLGVAALGAVVMTAWDLVMDPVMVAGGHWVWDTKGAYFGIPIRNYWGWWLTTFITLLLFVWLGRVRDIPQLPMAFRFDRLAILSYGVTGLSSILVGFRLGLGGPALVGLFAMVPWILYGWWGKSL